MSALLRRANLGGALISLDQLVLKAHADYNKQFAEAGAAHTKKRVCRYCNGAEQPYHKSRARCPMRAPVRNFRACLIVSHRVLSRVISSKNRVISRAASSYHETSPGVALSFVVLWLPPSNPV